MPKELRPGKYRLSCDVPKELYEDLRALSHHQDSTLTSILIKALVEYINSQKEYLKPYRENR